MIFSRIYQIEYGPKAIAWEKYSSEAQAQYETLLSSNAEEAVFQDFFERNPAFIPGAFEFLGDSGHSPYMNCLITQPDIGSMFHRKPDFLWLAEDSLNFCPVFIEIEKPSKLSFTKQGVLSAEFNQALGQLKEWRGILNNAINNLAFFSCFHIPQELQEKQFTPQFLLIYGRRSEYENNTALRNLRSQSQDNSIRIISYDRLTPSQKCSRTVTCKVQNGEYWVQHISPTFELGPVYSRELTKLKGFKEKIDDMEMTSEKRKAFLKERYPYWIEFGEKTSQGTISTSDWE